MTCEHANVEGQLNAYDSYVRCSDCGEDLRHELFARLDKWIPEQEETQVASDNNRYAAAAHAMQSAVAYELATTVGRELVRLGLPAHIVDEVVRALKHLRVGVNSAMSDVGALAMLLIAKGVFTETEYRAAVRDGMEREAELNARSARKAGNLPDTVKFG